ncbi:PAS domain-containing protein [Longitalea luteola]|uniref:PAS domain-containing protein n=1 Tax=Longitalea luteola TaxID=2812563 RepID=UPI001A9776D8|nr:PAS domain-containing protein [Longitalea luteola]
MEHRLIQNTDNTIPDYLSGGGEMGRFIREKDWSKTPLGNPIGWPQSLRSTLSICLNSNFPIAIYWGNDLILLYNDAWSPIPGNKHPWALGKPAKEVWPEIWDAIEPQFRKAFSGVPGGSKDAFLPMNRHGYQEECYFNFTFTPIYGEGGKVEGVFNAVIETTKTVLNERQLQTLRELGNLDRTSKTVDEVLASAAKVLQGNNKDFPFAIIYKIVAEENKAIPISYVGTTDAQEFFPSWINLDSSADDSISICKAYSTNALVVFENKENRKALPKGGWDIEATKFIHLPIVSQSRKTPIAILSAALNPYRQFDELYKQFVQLIADQISTEVNNALAYEEERKRAQALAEIDKAKTAFFTNISHEFRTPLTLILGSLEQLLNRKTEEIVTEHKDAIETSHRNALRMLRLVNNLLDFSRIEAGKVKARFQLTDLCQYTSELASNFRSVIEHGGLQFYVHCESISQPVYVDKEMWEKIVLNLLSNAFKYTLNGSISISLQSKNGSVILKVKDTGTGIPEEEIPKMFERFHRVQNVTGRTYEGTGIGLSLVKELVLLHGGNISVKSKTGEGTEFIISIPTGKHHLPAEYVVDKETDLDTAVSVAFIEEADSLLRKPVASDTQDRFKNAPTILVVDDNADMRSHIRNILCKDFSVVTANNGMDALLKIKEEEVDVVVSDVMMPVMDGIQLLKTIKNTQRTSTLPVILVSARAGEEAKIEGFDIGADDYLIKPFSAKELLARVRSQISISQKRDKALRDVYNLFNEVPFAVAALKGPELIIEYINQYSLAIWQLSKDEVVGKPLFDVRPDLRKSAAPIHEEVYRTKRRFEAREAPIQMLVNGNEELRYFNVTIDPMKDDEGNIVGQLATSIDVTQQVVARKKIEESETRVRIAVESGQLGTFDIDLVRHSIVFSDRLAVICGLDPTKKWSHHDLLNTLHPEDLPVRNKAYEIALQTGNLHYEARVIWGDGSVHWLRIHGRVKYENGEAKRIFGIAHDITDERIAQEKIRESEERFRALVNATSDVVYRMSPDWTQMQELKGRGFISDTGEPIKDWVNKYIHPKDQERVQQAIATAIKTKSIFELEHQVISADGTLGWTFSRAIPILDKEGDIVEWFGTASDITERIRIESQLKINEERYALTINATNLGIWDFDVKNQVVVGSGKIAAIYGLASNEEYNLAVAFDSIYPDDRNEQNKLFESIINGRVNKSFATEYRIIHKKSGAVKWIRAHGKAFFDEQGQLTRTVGTVADVTEAKLAEDALKESENRFRTLTQSLPQLVWTATREGYCDFFNQQWYDYTGSTPEQSFGDGWAKYIHPQHVSALYAKWQQSIKSGQPVVFEFQLKAKDNGYQWFYVLGNPVTDENGSVIKWVGALTNIEERKTIEEKLERLVADRTSELRQANQELHRSNDDLQQFAHVASHDLKEPVRKIRTFVSRLKEEYRTFLPEQGERFLQKIENAANRMNAMIDGVLTYSSLTGSEQKKESVDLGEVLEQIESDLELLIQQKSAIIEKGELPCITGSRMLLYQLFYNLINNSLKFVRQAESPVVRILSRRLTPDEIDSRRLDEGKEYVQIIVTDNGIGFNESNAEIIFKTFTRLNSKDQYEGTGLGLALCKKIVERHGGHITANGKEGEGAQFYITLPIS